MLTLYLTNDPRMDSRRSDPRCSLKLFKSLLRAIISVGWSGEMH